MFAFQVVYIALMMRRTLNAVMDESFLDDRDYYGNKRLELAGGQLSLLFEDLLKRLNTDLRKMVMLQHPPPPPQFHPQPGA